VAGEHLAEAATPADLKRVVRGQVAAGRREGRIVMAGRSNVGKSALVNALCGQTVARVSARNGASPYSTRSRKFSARSSAPIPSFRAARASSSMVRSPVDDVE